MRRPGADSKGSLTAWPAEDLGGRAVVWNTCSPVGETLNCAWQPPWHELGFIAWEEAAVGRVEAGTLPCIEAWRGLT